MRVSKLDKQKRIQKVQQWIIDGLQEEKIRQKIAKKWNISTRQAKRYIHDAYHAWKVDADIDMETRRQAKIAELKQLKVGLKSEYKGTPAGIRAIMQVEKQIIRLEPYSIHRIDITSGGEPLQMSPEEREERIKKLILKREEAIKRKQNADS